MQSILSRAGLLAGASTVVLAIAGVAQAETGPNIQDVYRMLQQQQQVIQQQQKELQELKRRVATQDAQIQQTKRSTAATAKVAADTNKAVRETEAAMVRKEDLDRTRAELGTQPSQSVFRRDEGTQGTSLFAEALIMRPRVDVPAALVVGTLAGPLGTVNTVNFDPGFDAGFRAGIGYRFASGWDVNFAYTYFRGGQTQDFTGQLAVSPLFPIPAPGMISRYSVNYDVADFEVGLNFLAGSDVKMRGFTGLRYVRLNQKLGQSISPGYAPYQVSMEARSNFWGVGPRAGISGSWEILSGLTIDAKFSGTLAVGSFKRDLTLSGGPVTAISQDNGSSTGINPGMDASIGLSYRFNLGGIGATVSAGYEFAQWFGAKPFKGMSFVGIGPFGIGAPDVGSQGMGFDGFRAGLKLTW